MLRDIEKQCGTLVPVLLDALRTHGIEVVPYAELGEQEKRVLREHYIESIFPLVTPQGFDPAQPFPFISNLSLNLFVTLHYHEEPEELLRARVKVPVGQGISRRNVRRSV